VEVSQFELEPIAYSSVGPSLTARWNLNPSHTARWDAQTVQCRKPKSRAESRDFRSGLCPAPAFISRPTVEAFSREPKVGMSRSGLYIYIERTWVLQCYPVTYHLSPIGGPFEYDRPNDRPSSESNYKGSDLCEKEYSTRMLRARNNDLSNTVYECG
jgi:hypothetical protein